MEQTLIEKAEAFIRVFYSERNIPEDYVYHQITHIEQVVSASLEIASGNQLSPKDLELLLVAAWFHDTGYESGWEEHEERSSQLAEKFLLKNGGNEKDVQIVRGCIMATKMPQKPNTRLEKILADADLSHLGKKNYWYNIDLFRLELNLVHKKFPSDIEFIEFELDFLNKHHFHNPFAKEIYLPKKERNKARLLKYKAALLQAKSNNKKSSLKKEIKAHKIKKKKKTAGKTEGLYKDSKFGRGVETMFRTAYRTHVNLSSIADNKANIMLSINAIVISIVISSLVPNFDQNQKLIIPTAILILVCLVAMVYATLSTRPKITEGIFSREDIKNRKSNLLFFGNFYNMDLKDFEWGMEEMIMDPYFQYVSMTRDLYWLGKVLAKKYTYLRICYNVFMYGLGVAVLSFAIALSLPYFTG